MNKILLGMLYPRRYFDIVLFIVGIGILIPAVRSLRHEGSMPVAVAAEIGAIFCIVAVVFTVTKRRRTEWLYPVFSRIQDGEHYLDILAELRADAEVLMRHQQFGEVRAELDVSVGFCDGYEDATFWWNATTRKFGCRLRLRDEKMDMPDEEGNYPLLTIYETMLFHRRLPFVRRSFYVLNEDGSEWTSMMLRNRRDDSLRSRLQSVWRRNRHMEGRWARRSTINVHYATADEICIVRNVARSLLRTINKDRAQ